MQSYGDALEEHGYAIVEDVLSPAAAFGPIFAEYHAVLDGIVEGLRVEGTSIQDDRDLPFPQRYLEVVRQARRTFSQHFDISLPRVDITTVTPLHHGPACLAVIRTPELLDLVETIIGPEISMSPVQHVRIKLPLGAFDEDLGLTQRVPWHQDQIVLEPEALDTHMLTVWVPLNEATVENGCLQVIPRSHRDGAVTHCSADALGRPTGEIAPRLVTGEPVPLPMRPGSVLLLDRNLMHCSLDNTTLDGVRISLDLRYHPSDQPNGRSAFPSFVVRSRRDPSAELRDAQVWMETWQRTREGLARAGGVAAASRYVDGEMCA